MNRYFKQYTDKASIFAGIKAVSEDQSIKTLNIEENKPGCHMEVS